MPSHQRRGILEVHLRIGTPQDVQQEINDLVSVRVDQWQRALPSQEHDVITTAARPHAGRFRFGSIRKFKGGMDGGILTQRRERLWLPQRVSERCARQQCVWGRHKNSGSNRRRQAKSPSTHGTTGGHAGGGHCMHKGCTENKSGTPRRLRDPTDRRKRYATATQYLVDHEARVGRREIGRKDKSV